MMNVVPMFCKERFIVTLCRAKGRVISFTIRRAPELLRIFKLTVTFPYKCNGMTPLSGTDLAQGGGPGLECRARAGPWLGRRMVQILDSRIGDSVTRI